MKRDIASTIHLAIAATTNEKDHTVVSILNALGDLLLQFVPDQRKLVTDMLVQHAKQRESLESVKQVTRELKHRQERMEAEWKGRRATTAARPSAKKV